MDSWGIGSFENKDAVDWANDIEELGEGDIDMALDHLIDHEKPLICACCEAVAAAEVVAALAGRPGENLPENITAWVAQRKAPTPELIEKARAALHVVMAHSELVKFRDKTGDGPAWHKNINGLIKRLA
jgi:hypothetical protein